MRFGVLADDQNNFFQPMDHTAHERTPDTIRRSPRLGGLEPVMTVAQIRQLRRGDRQAVRAVQQLNQVRRSPRLNL